jgi:acyl carrier protein
MSQEQLNDIFEKVRECVSKALQLDASEVSIDSKLIVDLGAESIDFLDIVFRLEKTFQIKIPRDDLFPEKVLTDSRYVKDGRVTAEGLELVKSKIPTVDFGSFAKDPVVSKLPDLFTVRMIVDYIQRRLQPA